MRWHFTNVALARKFTRLIGTLDSCNTLTLSLFLTIIEPSLGHSLDKEKITSVTMFLQRCDPWQDFPS